MGQTDAKIVELQNEKDLTSNVHWMSVPRTPEPYNRVAFFDDDVYFRLEVFALTKADLIAWMVENDAGEAFVTTTGNIYVSSKTTISMLRESNNSNTDAFIKLVDKIHSQAIKLFYKGENDGETKD